MFGLGKYKWPEVTFNWGTEQLIINLVSPKNEKIIRTISIPRPDITYTVEGNKVYISLVTKWGRIKYGKPIIVEENFWIILGCVPTTSREKVEAAYRRMSIAYHPDTGGTTELFQRLTDAKNKALKQCKR